VERAVVMAEGDELTIDLLPEAVGGVRPVGAADLRSYDLESLTREVVAQGIATVVEYDPQGLHAKIVESVEKELFIQILKACGGVRIQAATKLGINRNTLHKKIKDYGLDDEMPDQETGNNKS
jgi:DNA-binding NtrC family response regulator